MVLLQGFSMNVLVRMLNMRIDIRYSERRNTTLFLVSPTSDLSHVRALQAALHGNCFIERYRIANVTFMPQCHKAGSFETIGSEQLAELALATFVIAH